MTFNSGDSHRLSRLSQSVVQSHAENRHFGSGKNDLQKSRKARKGPWEALHGLLTPF